MFDRDAQSRRLARVTAAVALLLATFWAATLFAQDLGERAALQIDQNQAHLPLVTVFSAEYIDLPGSAIKASQVQSPAGRPHYRYTGARLLVYSNSRWFLLTGRYGDGYRSTAAFLNDTTDIRVEVARQR